MLTLYASGRGGVPHLPVSNLIPARLQGRPDRSSVLISLASTVSVKNGSVSPIRGQPRERRPCRDPIASSSPVLSVYLEMAEPMR